MPICVFNQPNPAPERVESHCTQPWHFSPPRPGVQKIIKKIFSYVLLVDADNVAVKIGRCNKDAARHGCDSYCMHQTIPLICHLFLPLVKEEIATAVAVAAIGK